MRSCYSIILAIAICWSQLTKTVKLTLETVSMKKGTTGSLSGVYNAEWVLIGGYDGGADQLKEWRTPIRSNQWVTTNNVFPDIDPCDAIWFPNQGSLQIGNLVWGFQGSYYIGSQIANAQAIVKYNLASKQFISISTYEYLSQQKQYYPCAIYNQKLREIYLAGGDNDQESTTSRVQKYDIDIDSWSYISDLNTNRAAAGCAMNSDSSSAFIFGGYDWPSSSPATVTDTIEEYDVVNDRWSILAAVLINPIDQLQCVLMLMQNIYCIGGTTLNLVAHDYVHVFNPEDGTIDPDSYRLNTPRILFAMASYENCLYVFGGEDNSLNVIDTIESLCLETDAPTDTLTTETPSADPTTDEPTAGPTTVAPTGTPTKPPTTDAPTAGPTTDAPTRTPTKLPTTADPTTADPTNAPTKTPTPDVLTAGPTTVAPTRTPTKLPTTASPTTNAPTNVPTPRELSTTTANPVVTPAPTIVPSDLPTAAPVKKPTLSTATTFQPTNKDVAPTSLSTTGDVESTDNRTKPTGSGSILNTTTTISDENTTTFVLSTDINLTVDINLVTDGVNSTGDSDDDDDDDQGEDESDSSSDSDLNANPWDVSKFLDIKNVVILLLVIVIACMIIFYVLKKRKKPKTKEDDNERKSTCITGTSSNQIGDAKGLDYGNLVSVSEQLADLKSQLHSFSADQMMANTIQLTDLPQLPDPDPDPPQALLVALPVLPTKHRDFEPGNDVRVRANYVGERDSGSDSSSSSDSSLFNNEGIGDICGSNNNSNQVVVVSLNTLT